MLTRQALFLVAAVAVAAQTSTPSDKQNPVTPAGAAQSIASAPAEADSTALEPREIVEPQYPDTAREKNIRGQVLAEILVSETGDVEGSKVLKGDPVLADAATAALKRWTFKPFLANGQATAAIAVVLFDFGASEKDGITDPWKVESTIKKSGPMPLRVRVSTGVTQSLLVNRVNPVYPTASKRARVQGAVVLAGTIGTDGAVKDVKLVYGDPDLGRAAADAVRQWQYKPYILITRPVEIETTWTINFTLSGG